MLELNANSEVGVRLPRPNGGCGWCAAKRISRWRRIPRGHFSSKREPVAVRAVGTAFNVRLAGDVEVLVTEGKVEIAESVGPAFAASAVAWRTR